MSFKDKLKAKAIIWFLKGVFKQDDNRRKDIFYYEIKKYRKEKEVKLMLDNVRSSLQGKKTYLVGVAAIVGALVSWSSGSIELEKLAELVIEAVLAMTIRSGISNQPKGE